MPHRANRLYRMIVVLLYATGLRRTEASQIKVEDIDSNRMVIHVRQGKGARDRDVPLSPKLLEELRDYWRWKKLRGYLFPSTAGQRGVDQPISDKTIWNACRVAATRAGLTKKIHPHMLRHSFRDPGGGTRWSSLRSAQERKTRSDESATLRGGRHNSQCRRRVP